MINLATINFYLELPSTKSWCQKQTTTSLFKYDKNKLKENPQPAVSHKDNFSNTEELFVQNKVFNVYQLNIWKLHEQHFFQNFRNQHIHTRLIFQN